MNAPTQPDHSQPTIADALVLILSSGGSLLRWSRDGSLEREWAIYHRLRPLYRRLVIVSDASPAEREQERAIASTLGCTIVMNDSGAERATYLAGLGRQVADAIEPSNTAATGAVVVKTNQLSGADAALATTDGLARLGWTAALIARGGYLWTRFVAHDHGPGSRLFAECASRERDLVRRADLVVGTSRSMLDDLAWRDGLRPEATRLIPNYITTDRAPGTHAVPYTRERGRLLYAGQLSARKRVDLLIDAVAMLARSARPMLLEIHGDGPELPALERRAQALGAPVWFGPRIAHAQLLDRMRACWAFVQASSLEGHPKTLLEAMSTGAAVVACHAPGVSDCPGIEHERTALLTSPDAPSLATAIARLLDDPALCARIGLAARGRVHAECSLDAITPLELAAHREALARAFARALAHDLAGATPTTSTLGAAPQTSPHIVVTSEPPPVRWDPALLAAPRAEIVRCWERSLNGFVKRLEPRKRAEFIAELDTYVYSMQGEAAVAAGNGIHPKHELMRYHDFFVDRIRPGERVLDLGCGIGAVASSIAGRAHAHVTGIDWSEKNLDRARDVVARASATDSVKLMHGDITSDRAPGAFDVIVLSNVLEHIAERPARLRQWRDWYGSPRFLIRVPAFDREWRVPWKKALGVEWRLDLTHETEYTLEQLERELKEAGLLLESVTTRWGEYYAQARAA